MDKEQFEFAVPSKEVMHKLRYAYSRLDYCVDRRRQTRERADEAKSALHAALVLLGDKPKKRR